jgi:hypothetical protein
MRKALIAALAIPVIAIGAAVAAFTAVALVGEDPGPVAAYPDLRALPPAVLRIREDRDTGRRYLRFQTELWNAGAGPLELRPERAEGGAETRGYQRLYAVDDEGNRELAGEEYAGSFAFHEGHRHWHFGEFAGYQLRAAGPGGMTGEPLVSANKVSFCLVDDEQIDTALPGSRGDKVYERCREDEMQGISVGWGDVYEQFLPGQSLDITGLANGDYWLTHMADPSNLIIESDETNNSAAVKIRIAGKNVDVLEDRDSR